MVIYYIPLIVLFALAIMDLVVGVANDAVNFTNSAVGSKAASRKTIFIVAGIGLLIGAFFSGGMLEIARKGIFYPQFFSYENIIAIFLAVMFTDVLLLDIFNTYGLPTSTTVSLVFELLGASVAVGLAIIFLSGLEFSELSKFINSDRALLMIISIFISVLLAFIFGIVIQFISRVSFSFKKSSHKKFRASIWSAISITLIFYFIFVKGLKGSLLFSADQTTWILSNTAAVLLVFFTITLILLKLLNILFNIDPLKIVVLIGTFGLALAFAANDLVNFIGVPIAGFISFQVAKSESFSESLMMSDLNDHTEIPMVIIFIAGIIMILTLWFSKKARAVTKTEVDLSRQVSEYERFGVSKVAKFLVDSHISIFNVLYNIIPPVFRRWVKKRYKKSSEFHFSKPEGRAAFDLLRASVNLTVASSLIAFGTSLKLPLSTTYVTFMVAMGTSLADGAWTKDIAGYRVNGVLTVISGWFVTAIIAFSASFVLALLIYIGDLFVIIPLIFISILFVIKSHKIFKQKKYNIE